MLRGKELSRLTVAMPKTETATPADGPTLQHGFRKNATEYRQQQAHKSALVEANRKSLQTPVQ